MDPMPKPRRLKSDEWKATFQRRFTGGDVQSLAEVVGRQKDAFEGLPPLENKAPAVAPLPKPLRFARMLDHEIVKSQEPPVKAHIPPPPAPQHGPIVIPRRGKDRGIVVKGERTDTVKV